LTEAERITNRWRNDAPLAARLSAQTLCRQGMNRIIFFLFSTSLLLHLCVLINSASVESNALDACLKQIPSSLLSSLKQLYPEHRIVTVSDYSYETIQWEKQYHDGNECLSVTKGDFDGNNKTDYAFLLTNVSKNEILIAARSKNNSWVIDKILNFNQGRLGTSYVNTLPPGNYADIWSGGEGIGRVENFSSDKQGIITGTIESSGVAYFFNNDGWVNLWLFD
jgi:hypothetical protein